jgi:cation-transporting P-type ATPase D
VTPEDLEMALLVGMSPHERRRLEKKKGYLFKAQAQNIITKSSSNNISENSGHVSENSHALSEQFPEDGAESNGQQEFDETESRNHLEDLTLSQGSSSLPVSMEDTTFGHDTATFETDTKQQASGTCIPANGHLHRDPSIGDNSNQAISKNAEKKISLLGHGHHGKQVVELLLSNGGEEAINQFCQRWRQVFVEAVHPRYLPSGWNINHRLVAFHTGLFFCKDACFLKTLFPMH